ncbi:MAG: ATP-grasp domain-containing protein [Candidatus Thorarchaeota archaeon]
MKRYNILVSGVGAIIGYNIIQSLRESRYKNSINIIGIDIYEDAIGQIWCDKFEKGILASDEEFPYFLKNIIKKYNINLVIPGIEQDIESIVNNYDILKECNTKYVVNKHGLIDLFNDKWKTHCHLVNKKIELIKTYIDGDYDFLSKELGIPFLLKPRRSYASKGIFKIETIDDYNYWKSKLGENFMVQEIVGTKDSEYTIGIFGLSDGTFSNMIILQRQLAADGSTAKAKVVEDKEIYSYIEKLCKIFKPEGPTNIQVIKHNNKIYLLEVNPRFSSTTSIRQAFGYNDAEMCIEYYLENKIPTKRLIHKGEARRYIKDYIRYDSNHF